MVFNGLLYWLNKPDTIIKSAADDVEASEKILEPSEGQKNAAQDSTHQRVKIIAGPGTGKSFVIEERVLGYLRKVLRQKAYLSFLLHGQRVGICKEEYLNIAKGRNKKATIR